MISNILKKCDEINKFYIKYLLLYYWDKSLIFIFDLDIL